MCHQGVCIVTGQAAGCPPVRVDVNIPVTCRQHEGVMQKGNQLLQGAMISKLNSSAGSMKA